MTMNPSLTWTDVAQSLVVKLETKPISLYVDRECSDLTPGGSGVLLNWSRTFLHQEQTGRVDEPVPDDFLQPVYSLQVDPVSAGSLSSLLCNLEGAVFDQIDLFLSNESLHLPRLRTCFTYPERVMTVLAQDLQLSFRLNRAFGALGLTLGALVALESGSFVRRELFRSSISMEEEDEIPLNNLLSPQDLSDVETFAKQVEQSAHHKPINFGEFGIL